MLKDSRKLPASAMAERPHQSSILPTPFHGASSGWNATNKWTTNGNYTVSELYTNETHEYEGVHAFVGVRDVTPHPKYNVHGKDIIPYLTKLVTANIEMWRVGYGYTTCICDENGYVIDVVRVIFDNPGSAYIVSTIPLHLWLNEVSKGYEVTVVDITDAFAVLGLYGPRTHDVIANLDRNHLDHMDPESWTLLQNRDIEFSALVHEELDQTAVEVWGKLEDAFVLWERVMRAGREVGIRPLGETVYEQCRIEAGRVRTNVDFVSPLSASYGNRPRTPFELGLDNLIEFEGGLYNGKSALLHKRHLHRSKLVGLFVNGRRPATGARIVVDGRTVGTVTSSVWSPRFMSVIGIATIAPRFAVEGTELIVETAQTVELEPQVLQRRALVARLPFN